MARRVELDRLLCSGIAADDPKVIDAAEEISRLAVQHLQVNPK